MSFVDDNMINQTLWNEFPQVGGEKKRFFPPAKKERLFKISIEIRSWGQMIYL